MKIDLSPLKGTLDHLALQLAIVLIVPFAVGVIVKWILLKVKAPKIIANYAGVLVLLVVFYKTLLFVLG